MSAQNGVTPPRPLSPRPGILSVAQARAEDGHLWVLVQLMTPYGETAVMVDPLDCKIAGDALTRFAELDQVAEKRLIKPGE